MARTDRMSSAHATTSSYTVLADSRTVASGPHTVLADDARPRVPAGVAHTERRRAARAGSARVTRTKRRLVATAGSTLLATALASTLAIVLAACGSASSGQTPAHASDSSATLSAHLSTPPSPSSLPAAVARARSHSRTPLAGDVAAAQTIYHGETQGPKLLEQLGRLARDPVLLSALARGDTTAAQAEADAQLYSTLNHTAHVTRIAVLRGSRVLVNATINANGVFVCAPGVRVLRLHGRALGTLLVSIQDVVGFVKLIHRLVHVQALVRGVDGLVRTSLPAAAQVALPASGRVTIASRAYLVRSFSEVGWGGEPLGVWVLVGV